MNQGAFNPYTQVYEDLESEIKRLAMYVDINDSQLSVHSSKIVTLALRAASEIESITKALHSQETGSVVGKQRGFEGPLKELIKIYGIEDVVVLLHGHEFYLSDPFFKPFRGWIRGWKQGYNHLKHNRIEYQYQDGNIKNLITMMAALYVLNCLFVSPKDKRSSFDVRMLVNSTMFTNIVKHNGKLGSVKTVNTRTFIPLDGVAPDSVLYEVSGSE